MPKSDQFCLVKISLVDAALDTALVRI